MRHLFWIFLHVRTSRRLSAIRKDRSRFALFEGPSEEVPEEERLPLVVVEAGVQA